MQPPNMDAEVWRRWVLGGAAAREARVEATFAHREAAAQPGEEALQAKPVAAVGRGAVSGVHVLALVQCLCM